MARYEDTEVRERSERLIMRDRRVRVAFLGLILALPVLMVVMNPHGSSFRQAALPILGVEAVLVGGLSTVARERQRLLAEQAESFQVGRKLPSVPHATRPLSRAPLGRS